MKIELANELFDDGTINRLYKSGFISVKFFRYREIYLFVDAQMKIRGITKNKAVLEAEIQFDVSEHIIWLALKCFSK